MRLIPLGRPAIRYVVTATLCAYALGGAFLQIVQAQQPRSVTDGVYSAGQATRGQQLYKAQCAECHGNAMEGTIGSPLAGDSFLSNWSARPLANFVDKIQKTMPFELPGSLSRQQSTDLAAYILQVGKFPAGQAELSEAMLAQIAFPATIRPTAPTPPSSGGTSLPPPEGNLAELMRAIAFPNSNILFNLQVKDPGTQPKKQPGSTLVRLCRVGIHCLSRMAGCRSGRRCDHRDGASPFDAGPPLSERQARARGSRRLEAVRCGTRGSRKARLSGIKGEELRGLHRYQLKN